MIRWLGLVFLVANFAIIGGCSAAKTVNRERLTSPKAIFARVQERDAKVRTLEGDGLLTIESPEGSNNGSFDVRLKKPDSLRLEMFGPFGVNAGTLLLCRGNFIYYDKLNNTAVLGRPDGKTLRAMFRLKLQFDEVLHAFTGEFPPVLSSDSLLNLSVQKNKYIIHYRNADGEKEYTIDDDSFVVTAYRVFDAQGEEILSAASSRIRMSDSIPVPKLLRVIFPLERRSVTIAYDDITLNRPTECTFSLPKQAEVIERE